MSTHQAPASAAERPFILVTGFSVFPGAPVNPTEALIERLRGDGDLLARVAGTIRTEVLPVEYDGLDARLEAIGKSFQPDIAIHFGLSPKARGFTLERLARNEIAAGRPDNAGNQPAARSIVEGGVHIGSTLPLAAMHAALIEKGLTASWSDDAGGYLCNFIFYHACGGLVPGYAPGMAGFVHVPPLLAGGQQDAPENAMALDDLVRGACLVIETCAREWQLAKAA